LLAATKLSTGQELYIITAARIYLPLALKNF